MVQEKTPFGKAGDLSLHYSSLAFLAENTESFYDKSLAFSKIISLSCSLATYFVLNKQ